MTESNVKAKVIFENFDDITSQTKEIAEKAKELQELLRKLSETEIKITVQNQD